MNIYQKLVEVRKMVPYLQKESKGHQYNYVGSSQVLAAVRSKMDELNLLLIPKVIGHNVTTTEKPNKNGGTTAEYFTELDMEFTWVNADDPTETIVVTWYGQGIDTAGEKGVGKAMTYAEKYFMLKQFNIATDKDDPDQFQNKAEQNEQRQENRQNKSNTGQHNRVQQQMQQKQQPLQAPEMIQAVWLQLYSGTPTENKLNAWYTTKRNEGMSDSTIYDSLEHLVNQKRESAV